MMKKSDWFADMAAEFNSLSNLDVETRMRMCEILVHVQRRINPTGARGRNCPSGGFGKWVADNLACDPQRCYRMVRIYKTWGSAHIPHGVPWSVLILLMSNKHSAAEVFAEAMTEGRVTYVRAVSICNGNRGRSLVRPASAGEARQEAASASDKLSTALEEVSYQVAVADEYEDRVERLTAALEKAKAEIRTLRARVKQLEGER